MARKLHFSRLLDMISGSALAGANTKVQKSALYKDFDIAKLESKKLRDLIDSNLPTFYIVDIDLIVKELVANLGFSNFSGNEDYIQSRFPKKEKLIKFLHDTIKTAVLTIPQKPFLPFITKVEKDFDGLINTLSKRTSYIGYRNATATFQFKLRTQGKSLGIFIASDANSIVENLGKNAYVVIAPTFNGAVEKVNTALNKALREAFSKSYDIELRPYSASSSTKNRFTIGDFINAGHTAAFDVNDKLIGINMPLAQERQFLLSGKEKSEGLELAIADLYLDANYDIKFKQNFTEKAGKMLDMQFSFVVTMPSAFNTNTLRTQELARIKAYIGNTILPTIAEQAKNKFKGGLLDDSSINTGASPSLSEYINDLLVENLKGNKSPRVVKTSTAKAKGTVKTHALLKTDAKLTGKTKSGGVKASANKAATSNQTNLNLFTLTTLINSQLQDVISANMGSGNSKNVLNYRTGRFASTVQVERLTSSRDGFVTAFYSYMKNPYATFSANGRQSIPATRDPKLLISKSIREIAQQVVGSKLRAVSL
jgi:hypothetical protein